MNLPGFWSVPRLLDIVIDQILLFQDQMLTFPVLDHSKVLQGADDIRWVDASFLSEGFDGDFLVWEIANVLQQNILPIGSVSDESEITEWLLRTSNLAFNPTETITEVDEESAKTLALIWR